MNRETYITHMVSIASGILANPRLMARVNERTNLHNDANPGLVVSTAMVLAWEADDVLKAIRTQAEQNVQLK